MKTTSFGSITVEYPVDSPDIQIVMKVPGEPPLSLGLSPDEVMLFLVELGNGLASCRGMELENLKIRELLKERRRSL
jgi:hypothetical protein